MVKKEIQIGLVGCGRIAKHHALSIQANPNLKLTAVCDLDLAKAEQLSNQFNVKTFQDYRQMLNECPEISVVAIMTPSGMHFEHATDIIKNFKKNVVVEKPTFLKLSDFSEIRRLALKHKCQIFPVFQNRYNKAVQKLKSAKEELGDLRILSVRVRWCRPQKYYDLSPWRGTFAQDGGALTNQGIHHVDLIRYLGGEVESVSSMMATLGAKIEVEDSVVAHFRFKSGALGNLEITTSARPDDFEASISYVGSKGLAQIGGIAVNELQMFSPNPKICSEFSEDFSGNVYGKGHEKLYRSLSDSLTFEKNYEISMEDAEASVELLHAFYDSAVARATVKVDDRRGLNRLGEFDEALAQLYRSPKPQAAS